MKLRKISLLAVTILAITQISNLIADITHQCYAVRGVKGRRFEDADWKQKRFLGDVKEEEYGKEYLTSGVGPTTGSSVTDAAMIVGSFIKTKSKTRGWDQPFNACQTLFDKQNLKDQGFDRFWIERTTGRVKKTTEWERGGIYKKDGSLQTIDKDQQKFWHTPKD